jgi:RNA polymerase sigma-70 factor (ECF subfamily)
MLTNSRWLLPSETQGTTLRGAVRSYLVAFRLAEIGAVSLTILQRVAGGEADAVDECLETYGGLVWSLARRFCSKHEDAEDAVQDTFVDIWRHAEKFDPEIASEATYITMIARRRLIDRFRRSGRSLDTTVLDEEKVSAESDHEKGIEVSEEAAQARTWMQQLRPQEREVLELSVIQGMSQSQIAEATDLPLGTVKTHARRGLIRLRELLGENSVSGVQGAEA